MNSLPKLSHSLSPYLLLVSARRRPPLVPYVKYLKLPLSNSLFLHFSWQVFASVDTSGMDVRFRFLHREVKSWGGGRGMRALMQIQIPHTESGKAWIRSFTFLCLSYCTFHLRKKEYIFYLNRSEAFLFFAPLTELIVGWMKGGMADADKRKIFLACWESKKSFYFPHVVWLTDWAVR